MPGARRSLASASCACSMPAAAGPTRNGPPNSSRSDPSRRSDRCVSLARGSGSGLRTRSNPQAPACGKRLATSCRSRRVTALPAGLPSRKATRVKRRFGASGENSQPTAPVSDSEFEIALQPDRPEGLCEGFGQSAMTGNGIAGGLNHVLKAETPMRAVRHISLRPKQCGGSGASKRQGRNSGSPSSFPREGVMVMTTCPS